MKTIVSSSRVLAVVFFLTIGAASSVFAGDGWLTDYKEALAQAKKENRPVLMDFTGSDWCGYCIKLNKEVFSQSAFKDFAKGNLVLLELDFPHGKAQSAAVKAQNEKLQQQFKVQGFPTLVLLSPDGKEIAREVGFSGGGPAEFIQWVKTAAKK